MYVRRLQSISVASPMNEKGNQIDQSDACYTAMALYGTFD